MFIFYDKNVLIETYENIENDWAIEIEKEISYMIKSCVH